MLKVRRENKDQKKNFSLKQQANFAKPLPSLAKPAIEAGQDNPEWLISEDWALLQVLTLLCADGHCSIYLSVTDGTNLRYGLFVRL